jgi:succinate dehydrogenase/fumarate reductase iron-sulfur protein
LAVAPDPVDNEADPVDIRMVTMRVFRFDPELDAEPRYDEFEVAVSHRAVVGDALEYIYEQLDPSLAFRYECRTRQCGSCVVQVDDEPRLFCMELIGNRREVRVEPLGLLPIVRDLVTDRSPLLGPLYQLEPRTGSGDSSAPMAIGPRSLAQVKLTEECAECLLCTAVCPAFARTDFAGPMLFNKLAGLAFDERDREDRTSEARAMLVDDCKSCFRCEEICPHEIPLRQLSIARLTGASRSQDAFNLSDRHGYGDG